MTTKITPFGTEDNGSQILELMFLYLREQIQV